MRAEQMIAGAAGLDAAGTGESRPDHAADGAAAGHAQQRGGVDRLEGELLVLGIDQRLHVGERGAGLHRDDQLVRLVGGDGVERGHIEHGIGRHRMADRALGAMADDLQRLVVGDRRAHHLFDVLGVSYLESIHAFKPEHCRHRPPCAQLRTGADDPVIPVSEVKP